MKRVNGVITLEGEESVKDFLPPGAPVPEFKHLYAPYGVKLRSFGAAYMWEVATEEDLRHSESLRLGVPPRLFSLTLRALAYHHALKAPVVATAFAVHIYKRMEQRRIFIADAAFIES
jgi:hypothetical protein